NVRLRTGPGFECPRDNFFGMPQAIYGSRVDPVDAQFQRPMNGGDGVIVVLRAPGELPATAPDRPGSITYGRDLQIGLAKLPGFHFNLLARSFDSKNPSLT